MRSPRPISENFSCYIILSIFKRVPIDLWKNSVSKIRSQAVIKARTHKNLDLKEIAQYWTKSHHSRASFTHFHPEFFSFCNLLTHSLNIFWHPQKCDLRKCCCPQWRAQICSQHKFVLCNDWIKETLGKRNIQRCVGDVYYFKGLGYEVNMKGIMGCRLVKLMQATIILAFSLFLKAQ